jgi:DNA/RNA endonuclease YhcR with UshA esterase domain
MKSKKLLSLLLVAAMSIACLAGCGKDNEEPAATPAPAATQTPTAAPAVDTAGVNAAKDYLNNMYASKDGSATATASDYTVVGVVKIDGVTYTVDWSVDVKSGVTVGAMDSKKMVKIDVDEKTSSQIDYTLTATLKDANGATASAAFKHFVPAYKEFSWNEYVAATEGQTVVVKGVVTAIIAKSKGNSTNALYFQDNDGGYYVYNMSKDPVTDLGIKEGMTVQATGKRSTYSGTYEIIEASVEIVNSTVNKVVPADYTELYKKAENLKDKNLTAKQGLLVSLKGVEIIGIGSDPTYFMFQLGDKQSYVRLSSSVCPITKDEQTTFKDAFTSHIGYLADATGILTLYDGAFYLSPVTADAFSNYTLPKRTDAEKVAFEKNQLGIPSKVQADTTLALKPTGSTYTDVAIRYDITGATHVGDTLPLVQTEKDQKITIVATLTCNDAKDTVTIELTVEAKASDLCEAEVLAKAFALADGETMAGTQVLRGKIVEIPSAYSDQYKNITVNMQVGDKIVQAYRLTGGSDLKVGDVITVTGTLKNYKGTVEFDKGCTYSKTLSVDEAKQLITLDKAFALAEGETMPGTQVLSGKIVEIPSAYSEQYKNITVNMQVGDKIVQAYRLTGGSDLKVGDVITVTGTLKNYKGTVEFDKGCTYVKGQKLAYAKDLLVMEKAYALAEGETMPGIQEITGTVSEIVSAYSEQYGNITVNMTVGDKTIQAYRLTGGSDIKVGDVITVTGTIKNYKGTVEFDKGCTYVKAAADSTPKTGDASMAVMFILLLMMAGSFTMMMVSKRKAR